MIARLDAMETDLLHLALGGTISMRVADGLAVPALSGAELAELAGISTTSVEIAALGGPQLTFGLLRQTVEAIAEAETAGAAGVIVTLGTDAIEEAGAFLTYSARWRTNVVLTGAMTPGGEPGSDGPQNMRDAAAVARAVRLPEPVVVLAGRVFLARAVLKVSGVDLDAFASPGAPSWSVAEVLGSGRLPGIGTPSPVLGLPGPEPVDVPVIVSGLSLGMDPSPADSRVPPAVVCLGSGAGNLAPEATAMAERALAAGSVVAIATRALDGRMSAGYGYAGGSGALVAAGAVLANAMSAHRVRIFLLIGLSRGLRGRELADRLAAHVRSSEPQPFTTAHP